MRRQRPTPEVGDLPDGTLYAALTKALDAATQMHRLLGGSSWYPDGRDGIEAWVLTQRVHGYVFDLDYRIQQNHFVSHCWGSFETWPDDMGMLAAVEAHLCMDAIAETQAWLRGEQGCGSSEWRYEVAAKPMTEDRPERLQVWVADLEALVSR